GKVLLVSFPESCEQPRPLERIEVYVDDPARLRGYHRTNPGDGLGGVEQLLDRGPFVGPEVPGDPADLGVARRGEKRVAVAQEGPEQIAQLVRLFDLDVVAVELAPGADGEVAQV